MSEDQEELNLNDLVGNLLAAHNEENPPSQLGEDTLNGLEEIPEFPEQAGNHDVAFGDDDLAAVVAQAIGGMEEPGNQDASGISQHVHEEQLPEELDQQERQPSKEEEWAQILQQGLLQESQQHPHEQLDDSINMEGNAGENLDQEDEALRRAILESLQSLNMGETQALPRKPIETSEGKPRSKEKDSHKERAKEKKAKKKEAKKQAKKKSSKKKKASSKKTKSTTASISEGKRSTKTSTEDDILNFEDVIKGFMEQGAAGPASSTVPDTAHESTSSEVGDAETQALVEATLKAFETELLAGSSQAPTSKPKAVEKKHTPVGEKILPTTTQQLKSTRLASAREPKASKTKKKASDSSKAQKHTRKSKQPREDYNEGDFTKALAEMVNQVVNTSLSDVQPPVTGPSMSGAASQAVVGPTGAQSPGEQQNAEVSSNKMVPEAFAAFNDPLHDQVQEHPGGKEAQKDDMQSSLPAASVPDRANDVDLMNLTEGLDLNQIMQNAMAMAFPGHSGEQMSQSAVDDFNRQLGGLNLSQLLDSSVESIKSKKKALKKKSSSEKGASSKTKSGSPKKKSSKSKKKRISDQELNAAFHAGAYTIPGLAEQLPKLIIDHQPKKPGRPKKKLAPTLSERHWKKKYKAAATAAAAKARRRRMDRNKAQRSKVKEERQLARQEKKLKKEEDQKREEAERKELEELVAKGPPYPPDLRLTKKGKPKKPYRRYTAEEMAKRSALPPPETISSRKVKRDKKKKDKKLKRTPLSSLRRIPLFNFIRGQLPPDAKFKLNDMDETLKRLPLSGTQLSNNEMTGSLVTEGLESQTDERRATKNKYDIGHKTVVHREKTPFHPPWVLPKNPPLALPIARRKKKGSDATTKKSTKSHRSRKTKTPSFISGNRIIPASLFPIINTLKAAARAKAAAGASPEEASRHLGNMLRTARATIAQTLANARGQGGRNYSSLKTMQDIQELQAKDRAVKKIPIFSLSSIKAIKKDDVEDTQVPGGGAQVHGLDSTSDGRKDTPQEIPISPTPERSVDPVCEQGSRPEGDTKVELPAPKPSAPSSEKDTEKDGGKIEESSAAKDTEAVSSSVVDPELKSATAQDSQKSEVEQSAIQNSVKSGSPENHATKAGIPKIKTESGVVVPPESDETVQTQADHLGSTKDDLPAEVKDELARTIVKLMESRPKPRRKQIRAPPTLNLEGLVPPNSSVKPEGEVIEVPEAENPPSLKSSREASAQPTVRKRKSIPPSITECKLEFTIPTKNVRGEPLRAISILRRAKDYLSAEEMTKLKKSVTNERKRKWREANANKNKNHDLKARLKKRANALFGEHETTPKTEWIETEYKNKATKLEEGCDDSSNQNSSEPTTSVSDVEVLRMIAFLFDKEEVSRAIEKNIHDEANLVPTSKKLPMRKKSSSAPHVPLKIEPEHVPQEEVTEADQKTNQSAVKSSSDTIDPIFTRIGKRNQEGDLEEEGESKRRKENDFLEKSLLRRPAYINLENN